MSAAPAADGRAVVDVPLGDYRITVAAGQLDGLAAAVRERCPAHRYALVTDETVAGLYAERVLASFGADRPSLHVIPAGERHKTRATWADLTDQLLADGHGRDSAVVALGGGVVGDLAGFVAATFMRGIPYVQVPTTLLAMIDASIGGKTGVDTLVGKNLVGAFHQPRAVLADPEVLATLPAEHRRAGLAEAIKHGVIADAGYFARVTEQAPRLLAGASGDDWLPLVARSVEIKASVVARDEREAGLRKVLNLGHTLGHAVELLSGFQMLHGEAVAVGMVLEAAIAERLELAEAGTRERIVRALRAAGLPTAVPAGMAAPMLLEATRLDKKSRGGSVEYALPARVGAMAGEETGWGVRVPDALVLEVVAESRGTG